MAGDDCHHADHLLSQRHLHAGHRPHGCRPRHQRSPGHIELYLLLSGAHAQLRLPGSPVRQHQPAAHTAVQRNGMPDGLRAECLGPEHADDEHRPLSAGTGNGPDDADDTALDSWLLRQVEHGQPAGMVYAHHHPGARIGARAGRTHHRPPVMAIQLLAHSSRQHRHHHHPGHHHSLGKRERGRML